MRVCFKNLLDGTTQAVECIRISYNPEDGEVYLATEPNNAAGEDVSIFGMRVEEVDHTVRTAVREGFVDLCNLYGISHFERYSDENYDQQEEEVSTRLKELGLYKEPNQLDNMKAFD